MVAHDRLEKKSLAAICGPPTSRGKLAGAHGHGIGSKLLPNQSSFVILLSEALGAARTDHPWLDV